MNGYDAVVDILKKEGFEWIACFPANPLIEAAGKAGLKPIVFRQERGGILTADGQIIWPRPNTGGAKCHFGARAA